MKRAVSRAPMKLRARFFFIRLCMALGGCASIIHSGMCQSQAPASDSASRLRDLETTYQQELRRIQAPLLTEYAARLQQLAATAPAGDLPAIRAEIARAQKLINEGGIVDLKSANEALAGVTANPPMAGRLLPDGQSLALSAEQALNYVPTGETPPAIALGEAIWSVPRIDEGAYDIIVQYACTGVSEPAAIRVSFDDQVSDFDLPPNKVTRDASQFRLMRIGRFRVDREAVSKPLKIELKAPKSVVFRLRQLVIAKAKPGAQ